jgi:hypothetical protein
MSIMRQQQPFENPLSKIESFMKAKLACNNSLDRLGEENPEAIIDYRKKAE